MKFLRGSACLILLSLSIVCSARTYKIVLQDLPKTIDPAENNINIFNSILLHLYQPLFHIDSEGILKSNLIDLNQSKSLSANFDSYRLCVAANSKFWNGDKVTSEHLRVAINRGQKYSSSLSIISNLKISSEDCLNIILRKRDLRFFNKLTGTITSPYFWNVSNKEYPIGTGPFKPVIWSPDLIKLVYVANSNPSFKNIEFVRYSQTVLSDRSHYIDWNHVMMEKVPSIDLKKYVETEVPLKKVYAVVISVRNEDLRKKLNKCISLLRLSKRLKAEYKSTSGFLPEGILGSGVSAANKSVIDLEKCRSLKWPTWIESRTENQTAIESVLKEEKLEGVVPFSKISFSEMGKRIFAGGDWIGIIGFDSTNDFDPWSSDPFGYFNMFFERKKFVPKIIDGMAAIAKEGLAADDLATKSDKWREVHKLLLESNYVVPIGELVKKHNYPKNVIVNEWADVASSFPQVDLMTVE